jgi:hypothetical protein
MAIALAICLSCAALGWPFIHAGVEASRNLPASIQAMPFRHVVRAALPMLPGLFLWAVAASFLLSALIKVDVQGKFERHMNKFVALRIVAMWCLWLTVPIAVLWVCANLLVGEW